MGFEPRTSGLKDLQALCPSVTETETKAVFTLVLLPDANGTRRVARVHTASTASGSSGTRLRPHREVFSVDANGTRRVGAAM